MEYNHSEEAFFGAPYDNLYWYQMSEMEQQQQELQHTGQNQQTDPRQLFEEIKTAGMQKQNRYHAEKKLTKKKSRKWKTFARKMSIEQLNELQTGFPSISL
ncbi:hypothetical protein Ciccas_006284 [Cichlidogyrus casuarinus]|uniref:Uncharacterized protein n=1 Tax=Cichlidogyrus casuarinus TaxID=1844966 RepID=A0ABD2Q687_9PLAT